MRVRPGVRRALVRVAIASAIGGAASCSAHERPTPQSITLIGAGATFPYPLYRAWFSEFEQRHGTRINYFAVGSTEGLRLLERGDADFAASDKPAIASATAHRASCGRVAIPMARGPLAIAYHLPPSADSLLPLRLDVGVLADIFAGRVTRWSAPAIRALNPKRRLPDLPIAVIHRADGSGTSRAFSDFLSASDRWRVSHVGDTSEVQWPIGTPAEGNAGVALEVKVREGAIGYVELSYARQNRLSVAAIRVHEGEFVLPGTDPSLYPAMVATWLIVDPTRLAPERASAFVRFVSWAQQEGSTQTRELEYTQPSADSVAYFDSLLAAIPFDRCFAKPSGSAARDPSRGPERSAAPGARTPG